MVEISYYESEEGRSPFAEWSRELNAAAADRVVVAVQRMEQGNFGDHKGVGEGVFERRLTFGPGYRIYYGCEGEELVILLVGGTKKRQSRDITRAKTYWADYRRQRASQNEEGDTTDE